MALASLIKTGWPLDKEKLRVELEKSNKRELFTAKVTKKEELNEFLINIDIALISQPSLSKDVSKLKTPVVLQLAHWRNVSHSVVQNHQGNTGVCRLELTDGYTTVCGFSTEPLGKLSGKTAYGSKVLLKSQVNVEKDHLLLTNENVELLGGEVVELKERWSKEQMQIDIQLESSAPKWVSVDRHEEKKREADEICREFNSFKCFANTPWITQQKPNEENEKVTNEFNRKRRAAVDAITVPRKRPRFLFHRHW